MAPETALEQEATAAHAISAGLHAPSRLHRVGHFWVLVVKSFMRNRCPVRASALAYTTLLALIPLLAVVVSVTTTLLKKEGEKSLTQFIDKMVGSIAPQLDVEVKSEGGVALAKRQEVVATISSFISNIQSGTLGTTGMIGLVFVAIMLLSTIETTFNDIWGVERGRSWTSRVVQYWAAITLGPAILVLVIGLTTGPHFKATQNFAQHLPFTGQVLFNMAFNYLPFVLLSLGFALFYQAMPNTKVHFRAALIGGVVGGCLWQLNNKFSVIYVSKVTSDFQIYGTFGMLPIFLAGLYFSWLILIFGAQVAYAFQNRQAYLQERLAENIHQQGREFIALRLMACVGRRFQNGEKPATSSQLAGQLGVPSRLLGRIAGTMIHAGLLLEVANGETAYVLARPLEAITCHDILRAMRVGQGQELMTTADESRRFVQEGYSQIQRAEATAASAVTLAALARQEQSQTPG